VRDDRANNRDDENDLAQTGFRGSHPRVVAACATELRRSISTANYLEDAAQGTRPGWKTLLTGDQAAMVSPKRSGDVDQTEAAPDVEAQGAGHQADPTGHEVLDDVFDRSS
jgi:hypothetical protein